MAYATETVAKSCFLFDNCITHATVFLPPSAPAKKAKAPEAPLATAFIQFRHEDGSNTPEFFDGRPLARGAHVSIADNKPHTLLASGGHGYYLHPTTESVELFRREQENYISENQGKSTYKGGVDPRKPRPELGVAYKGDFTTGYWLHDTNATQHPPVIFTLIVRSGEAGLANFASRMKNPSTSPARFTHSPTAHILYSAHKDMWGGVFFAAGERGAGHELNAAFPVLEADRPCSILLKTTRSAMTLAVAGGEELIKAPPAPFKLTLKGRWRLADDMDPKAATAQAAASGTDTVLVVAASAPAGNPVRLVAR